MSFIEMNNIYLDWVNNFVSIEGFASYYGYTEEEAITLIELSTQIHERVVNGDV